MVINFVYYNNIVMDNIKNILDSIDIVQKMKNNIKSLMSLIEKKPVILVKKEPIMPVKVSGENYKNAPYYFREEVNLTNSNACKLLEEFKNKHDISSGIKSRGIFLIRYSVSKRLDCINLWRKQINGPDKCDFFEIRREDYKWQVVGDEGVELVSGEKIKIFDTIDDIVTFLIKEDYVPFDSTGAIPVKKIEKVLPIKVSGEKYKSGEFYFDQTFQDTLTGLDATKLLKEYAVENKGTFEKSTGVFLIRFSKKANTEVISLFRNNEMELNKNLKDTETFVTSKDNTLFKVDKELIYEPEDKIFATIDDIVDHLIKLSYQPIPDGKIRFEKMQVKKAEEAQKTNEIKKAEEENEQKQKLIEQHKQNLDDQFEKYEIPRQIKNTCIVFDFDCTLTEKHVWYLYNFYPTNPDGTTNKHGNGLTKYRDFYENKNTSDDYMREKYDIYVNALRKSVDNNDNQSLNNIRNQFIEFIMGTQQRIKNIKTMLDEQSKTADLCISSMNYNRNVSKILELLGWKDDFKHIHTMAGESQIYTNDKLPLIEDMKNKPEFINWLVNRGYKNVVYIDDDKGPNDTICDGQKCIKKQNNNTCCYDYRQYNVLTRYFYISTLKKDTNGIQTDQLNCIKHIMDNINKNTDFSKAEFDQNKTS